MESIKMSKPEAYIFESGCEVDHKLWYVPWHYNSLCYFDLETGENCQVDVIPGEVAIGERLYCKIYYYEGKLILLPNTANHIVTYDIEKRSFQQCLTDMSKERFYSAVLLSGKLYLVPIWGYQCYCYDIEKNETILMESLSKIVRKTSKEGLGTLSMWYMEKKIYFLIYMTNICIVYDTVTNSVNKMIIGSSADEVFFDMITVANGVFAFATDGAHSYWMSIDGKDNIRFKYPKPFNELYPNCLSVIMFEIEGKVYASMLGNKDTLVFDIDKRTVEKTNLFPDALNNDGWVLVTENRLFLLPTYTSPELITNQGNRWKFDSKIKSRIIGENILKERIQCEDSFFSLRLYVQAVVVCSE